MWWPDTRGLFVDHAIWHYSFAWLTWYLICDPWWTSLQWNCCKVIGFILLFFFYLVVNVWPFTVSVDSSSRPETVTVAYLILFFSKFCVQSYDFHLWGLQQVIPSFYIIYINLYISDFVPCVSSGTVVRGLVLYYHFLTNLSAVCHWTLAELHNAFRIYFCANL